jgi:phospholipid/cholesterol/gamma-HCH transport system substrate-binding protein
MIARKYETVVGIFVVASLAALLVMVVIVAQQEGLFQEYVQYRAVFKNVSGLKTGSEVHLAGVTVGNVLNTVITPDGNIVVTFQVTKKYSDRIRRDSTATIGFMGLLGEKSLDLTPGSQDKPLIPAEGIVASVEPLDITQIIARAAPSLNDLQKVLTNLVSITQGLSGPESDFSQIMADIKGIVGKINQGKGSLGMLVNDPALYRETTQTVAVGRKVLTDFDQSIFGALKANSPEFKKQVQQTAENFRAAVARVNEASTHVQEAATRLPDIFKKLDSFLTNLDKAGKGLPGLVTQGETAFSDLDKTTKALQKSWLLRRYVPQPQERTIRMDAEPGKD